MAPNINQEDIQRFMLVLKGCRPRLNYGEIRYARFVPKYLHFKQTVQECIQKSNKTSWTAVSALPFNENDFHMLCLKADQKCDHYNFQIQVTGSTGDN